MLEANFFSARARFSAAPSPALVVLFGFHEYLGESLIREIRQGFIGEVDEFSFKRYYLDSEEDKSWDEILREAQNRGLFLGAKKMVLVVIRNEKKLSLGTADRGALQEYLKKPNPQVLLVVFVSLDILRDDFKQVKKTRLDTFFKAVDSPSTLRIDLDRVSDIEIRSFLRGYFKERKIVISSAAIEKLLESRGEDVLAIIQQLPKLEMAAGDSRNLDSEILDQIISGVSSHSIWDLTEAVENEDATAYMNILNYLFINGIKPSFIIGTLITYYNKIYTAKFLLRHRFPVADICKILQQPAFIFNKFISLVRGFSEFKIHAILNLIYRLDFESKTGGEEMARISLQNFIFQVKTLGKNLG